MSVAEPRQNALPQKYISTLWKGAVIGGTMLVPGVSGGSIAMILGIYQELISAVSSFRKQKKSNFLFLTVFCISAVFGMLVIATPISNLIDIFPKPTMYFFIGAVTGGIHPPWRDYCFGNIFVSGQYGRHAGKRGNTEFPIPFCRRGNCGGRTDSSRYQCFLSSFAAGSL